MATTSRQNLKEDVQRERDKKRQQVRDEIRRKNPRLLDTITEFQPDAVEIEQRSIPGGARWTLYTVFALIAAICLWAAWAEVDRVVTAPGKFVIDKAIMIQTAADAPIREIHARFGQIVKANDLLATLDQTFSEADVNQVVAKLNSFNAAFERLKAERDGLDFSIAGHENDLAWITQFSSFVERKNEYQSKIAEFASEHKKLELQIANNEITIETQNDLLKVLKEIAKKFAELAADGNKSEIESKDKQLQVQKTIAEIKTLEGKAKEIEAEMAALADRKAAFEANWRSEIAKLMAQTYSEISENNQLLNKANRAKELVEIRVPNDLPYKEFYVLEVADRTVGSTAKSGEPLFKLIPTDATIEVEIKVPDKDVGQVKIGQQVRIKLSSLPYQRHGYLTGVIRTISEDSIERDASAGMPRELTFIARVELTKETVLENVPDSFRLRPGLLADTEIKVGRRRVYEYFLYPLIRSLDSSIREP